MECPAENTWLRYLGGEVDERAGFEQHLDGCAACRLIYADLVRGEAPPVFARGAQLGRYVVLDVIGRGGMGIVYKAFDPELDRAVALKLVAVGSELDPDAARQRLVREAKTLARLSHPNVVAVHDVGTIDGDVFVAMEYVAGATLRQWLRERPRTPREIVDVLVSAARGLAAAHRLAIVHRDFKPENVMVEDDGRARVLDFGLARSVGTIDRARASTDRGGLPSRVTRTGAIAGTPPYMAPEQTRGDIVDARSDQYSFCVVLYEALYGERPPRDARPAARRGVSGRMRRALLVGLRGDPAQRHVSMDALIEALRDRTRVRVAVGALAVAALAAAGVALWTVTHAPSIDDACALAADDVARVWNPARRGELVARVATAADPGLADRVAARIDGWTSAWSARRKELCAQTIKSDRDQSQDIAQQVGCLRRRLSSLDASVSVIVHGKLPEIARDADGIVERAGAPTVCDSYERGTIDDATRARWRPVLEDLITAQVAIGAGRLDDAERAARAAVASARTQPESEVLGGALGVLGLVQVERGQHAEAHATLLESIRLATAAREDRIVVDGWLAILLAAMRGYDKDTDAAIFGAETAALKLPEDEPARCMVAARAGAVHARRGEVDAALAKLERGLACWSQLGTTTHKDAIAETSFVLGLVRSRRGEWDAAERGLAAAVATWEPEDKPHADLVMALDGLGTIALVHEDEATAERQFRRAVEVARALGPAGEDALGESAGHLAYVLVRGGRCADAAPFLAQARTHHTRRHGERSVEVAGVMLGEAMCALAAGEAKRARGLLEIAKPIVDAAPAANASQVALTDFHYARALVATGGSRRRALELARGAFARLANHPFATHRREIAAWLEAHR